MLPLGRFPELRSAGYEDAYASIRRRHPGAHSFTPKLNRASRWTIDINVVQLGRARVIATRASGFSIITGADELVRVCAPLQKSCEITFGGGKRLLRAGAAVCTPAGEFESEFEEGFRGLIVTFPRSAVREARRCLDQSPDLTDGLLAESFFANGAPFDGFRRQLLTLVRALDDPRGRILAERRFLAANDELLLLHLADGLSAAHDADGSKPGAAYLSRALDFIHAHALDEIGPVAIASAAGCSLRNLQLLFRREHGQTITETVRRVRLQKARERLSGASGRDTITSVALDCGFYHLGDFARHYRREFGEKPSQTLADARSRRA